MSSRKAAAGRSRRVRISNENRAGMITILMVVCLLFAVLLYEGFQLQNRIGENEQRRTELEAAIEKEEQRTSEIEARREYMKSDEYVRQAARDRLGLLESGELIFKPGDT